MADREALHRILATRRDVRPFRPDPVPAEVLLRALDAAHHGPSVGHSQPWRFLVVSEQRTRDAAALLADRERLRQANQLPEDRRRRLLDLQIGGLREAPVGFVASCDRRTAPERVLGRARRLLNKGLL
ncbi:MAG: nitroreductase family protein [Motilibacteraceae bacterium]